MIKKLKKIFLGLNLICCTYSFSVTCLLRKTKSNFTIKRACQQYLTTMSEGRKRSRQDLHSFFTSTKRSSAKKCPVDQTAEQLARQLDAEVTYLTGNGASWYILVKKWYTPPKPQDFDLEWDLHPADRRNLKVYGRIVREKRWSQAWGISMGYSGLLNEARRIDESVMVPVLLNRINTLIKDTNLVANKQDPPPYNACLQNWYEEADSIGLHSDDEKSMRQEFPIFSLSWGGTRRFLFRSRKSKDKVELWLEDGDLLVMGGTCQFTHQHEIPKIRVTMDPPTSKRINWTIRALHAPFP